MPRFWELRPQKETASGRWEIIIAFSPNKLLNLLRFHRGVGFNANKQGAIWDIWDITFSLFFFAVPILDFSTQTGGLTSTG